MHWLWLVSEKVPAGQSVHAELPASGVTVPVSHLTHCVCTSFTSLWPSGQLKHSVLPGFAYLPAAQAEQSERPAVGAIRPSGQLSQTPPCDGLLWPAWHGSHLSLPPLGWLPFAHGEHSFVPVEDAMLPIRQRIHDL